MPRLWIAAPRRKKGSKGVRRLAETSLPSLKKLIKARAEKTGERRWIVVMFDVKMTLSTVRQLINNPYELEAEEAHLLVIDGNGRCRLSDLK